MKSYINHSKVATRARLANLSSVGGLVLLLVSVIFSLFFPNRSELAYVLMIIGMGVAMVGIYFANRWVRKPRPEDSLARALRSFDNHYCLYHYLDLPCDHVLLTPTGLVIFEVYNIAGNFTYRQGRWREAMTVGRALRYIVEERVGNPVRSLKHIEIGLKEYLNKELGSDISVPIKSVVVFSHPSVELKIKDAPITICKIDKLKKHILIRGQKLKPEIYEKLCLHFEQLTVE
jgi:hypothetical protein